MSETRVVVRLNLSKPVGDRLKRLCKEQNKTASEVITEWITIMTAVPDVVDAIGSEAKKIFDSVLGKRKEP
jgi:phage-related protein